MRACPTARQRWHWRPRRPAVWYLGRLGRLCHGVGSTFDGNARDAEISSLKRKPHGFEFHPQARVGPRRTAARSPVGRGGSIPVVAGEEDRGRRGGDNHRCLGGGRRVVPAEILWVSALWVASRAIGNRRLATGAVGRVMARRAYHRGPIRSRPSPSSLSRFWAERRRQPGERTVGSWFRGRRRHAPSGTGRTKCQDNDYRFCVAHNLPPTICCRVIELYCLHAGMPPASRR